MPTITKRPMKTVIIREKSFDFALSVVELCKKNGGEKRICSL